MYDTINISEFNRQTIVFNYKHLKIVPTYVNNTKNVSTKTKSA
jgi:hypothetical protein